MYVHVRTRVTGYRHFVKAFWEEIMKNLFSETVSEKRVERDSVKAVKRRGGLALKFVSPGRIGVPDRIVLLPDGKCAFAEIKRLGAKLRKSQIATCQEIAAQGFRVHVIRTADDIQLFCEAHFGG